MDLSEISGIRDIRSERGITFFAFVDSPAADTFRILIERLTDLEDLSFYDHEHPELSDPGAYIDVIRYSGELFAMRGNHGWMSKWIPISAEDAASYLALCAPHNRGPGPDSYELQVSVRPAPTSIDSSPQSDFRLYLSERLR